MLDIIFISFDELNAEKNWAALLARFPFAQRVHGVKGIANAHMKAAQLANTKFFYVVDADAEVSDDFNFSYAPSEFEKDYVHIWPAYNEAIDDAYGYGGIKLFSKDFFKSITSQLDFSTTLAKGIKIMPGIACKTKFNFDGVRAFRGAFRESVKLYATTQNPFIPDEYRTEAEFRLIKWLNPKRCMFRRDIKMGAEAGVAEAKSRLSLITANDKLSYDLAVNNALMFINDHELMVKAYGLAKTPVDTNTDPRKIENCTMKNELFFTTRIAAAMYDDYVLKHLPVTELRDALSDGQMLSKLWLTQELSKLIESGQIPKKSEKLNVVITGGWIGTLALMINTWELPVTIANVDLDKRALLIANTINYGFDYTSVEKDMYDVDYNDYDIIINTSSEHITDIRAWVSLIPKGKTVIIQNNNFDKIENHISNVYSSGELREILGLDNILYEGTRKFPMYERYMVIGIT